MLLAYNSPFPTKAEEIKEEFKSIIILFELPKFATQNKYYKCCLRRYSFG